MVKVNLQIIQQFVNWCCRSLEMKMPLVKQKTPVDAKLGIELHKSLRLTRREASQGKFWAYLATQIPEFYSWRWGETGMLAR